MLVDLLLEVVHLGSERAGRIDGRLDPGNVARLDPRPEVGNEFDKVIHECGQLIAELWVVPAWQRRQRLLGGTQGPIELVEESERGCMLRARRIRDRLGVSRCHLGQDHVDRLDRQPRDEQLRVGGAAGLSLRVGARSNDEGDQEQREEPDRSAGHGPES